MMIYFIIPNFRGFVKGFGGFFHEKYGMTYEEAQTIYRDSSNPLQYEAFLFVKYMGYYEFKSLSLIDESEPDLRNELPENYPVVSEMDIYVLNPTTTPTEFDKLDAIFHEIGVTIEDVEKAHQKTQFTIGNPELPRIDGWYIRSVKLPATLTDQGRQFFADCPNITDISFRPA